MSVQVSNEIGDATEAMLQDLIQINADSEESHLLAADCIEDSRLASLFRSLARHRGENVRSLSRLVSGEVNVADDEGSYAKAPRRQWLHFQSVVGRGSELVLTEALKGENQLKLIYLEAMREAAGSPASPMLQRQFESLLKDADRLRYEAESCSG